MQNLKTLKNIKRLIDIIKILRFYHWSKNFLIFLPLFVSHKIITIHVIENLFLGFLSFSLCASAMYIINDLLDLKSDRKNFYKKNRPLASQKFSKRNALLLFILLIFISFFLALKFNTKNLFFFLIAYCLLSFFYSLSLKKIPIVDVLILSIFYVFRIFLGGDIVDIKLSFWLINFIFFFFLSLSFVKRYSEYKKREKVLRRGYYGSEKILFLILGINSGYISVLLLTLYINSDGIVLLYKRPELMWGCVFIVLFWINYIWLKVYRNKINQDPVHFAVKDAVSICSLVILFVIYIFSTY
jgi:4-hydroxybenzoate polyprenyltransferase